MPCLPFIESFFTCYSKWQLCIYICLSTIHLHVVTLDISVTNMVMGKTGPRGPKLTDKIVPPCHKWSVGVCCIHEYCRGSETDNIRCRK